MSLLILVETRVVVTWGNEIIAFLNSSCGSDPLQIGTLSSFFPSKTANRNEKITKASTVLGECSYQAGLGAASPLFSAGHEFPLFDCWETVHRFIRCKTY